MITYKTELYLIRCLTNLHAGSGDANYGVVDKLVQRDPITGYPCIHAPSLKGAIREHFATQVGGPPDGFMRYVFGSDTKRDKDIETGAYRFFSADLLSLPVRASGNMAFYRVTSKRLLEGFTALCVSLQMGKHQQAAFITKLTSLNNEATVFDGSGSIMLEDFDTTVLNGEGAKAFSEAANGLESLLGKDIAFVNEMPMGEFAKSLPVIARNQLENGISENLWYEEVVPRETRFFTFISVPYKTENGTTTAHMQAHYKHFSDNLDTKVIQVGANATIGYGQCHFTKIPLSNEQAAGTNTAGNSSNQNLPLQGQGEAKSS